ncbi:type II secretion system minor pseudopilin GspK [Ramlibacter sp. GTP1]|uniref:Type II secretion system protein K n=2 Tax=Ramlibacter albus TaxID=2079448 RepID=A0A923M766_9BURK|nr:type II secretion system minor pseudopilin GspK [Ramlibacter albus]
MRGRQRGAALLAAMLVVTLVATFAAAALWQQWRSVEVESAERSRVQSAWILTGALDWARLILREDARAGGADHLAEPWAVPLQEARLSSFLAADRNNTADMDNEALNVFISGQITDLQSLLNVTNLVESGTVSQPHLRQFARLFDLLGLPQAHLTRLVENLRFASDIHVDNRSSGEAALLPQRVEQLVWLGVPVQTVAVLEPYITILPARRPVNLNTAPAEVLYAVLEGISMADAQRLVSERERSHFRTISDAAKLVSAGPGAEAFADNRVSVASGFFEVRGRIRLGKVVIEERSIVQRDGLDVRVVQREKGVVDPTALSRAAAAATAQR